MHIKDKLAEAQRTKKPVFSFEFFPPKTAQVLKYSSQTIRLNMLTEHCRVSKTSMTVRL